MKKIFQGTIIIGLLVVLSGCAKEEWLNPAPVTSLSDLTVFDTKDRIVAQVNGMYTSLKYGHHLGGRFQVYNDIRAGNFIPNSTNNVTGFLTWEHNVLSSTNEVQYLWLAVYKTVNVVNAFLDGLTAAQEAGKLEGVITQAEYDQFRSEAYTIRAICYFNLMQMYSKPYHMGGTNQGVPLRLTAQKSSADNDLAPSPVAEIYNQIIADLDAAEPLAIATYGDAHLNTTRVHKNTIIAYKTRVLLHMHDWNGVVTESAKIVPATAPFTAPSGVANALNPSYANIFETPFTSVESVLSMPMTSSNNPGTQNFLAHYFDSGSDESYHLDQAAGSVYQTMDASDARKVMLSAVVKDGITKIYLTKYTDRTGRAEYAPVIRYAEVLLNRAEAIVRSGNAVTQAAVDLLNAVRARSFAAGAYTLADFASADAFYTAILQERNFEFLGEGIRNLDLMRLGLTIPGVDGRPVGGNLEDVPSSSAKYIWPVPANELAYNRLMTPNN